VKAFAKMMMGEHHALRVAGQQLAKKLNVTPQAPADDPVAKAGSAEMAALNAAGSGASFDRAYIDPEVGIHKAVLDLADKAHGDTENAQLKGLIAKAKPVIQKHLDKAKELQQKAPELQQKAQEVKPQATRAAWITFGSLIFSLLAALIGSAAGRRRHPVQPTSRGT
jgi:hypothetical protein